VLPIEAARYGLDVLFNPGFTAPMVCPCPQVTTFHDLQHKRHPEHFRWYDLPFWRFLLWAAVHRSRSLIAVSEATQADLLEIYKIAPERIHVVHHGVDPIFLALERSRPEKPYLLCVSTLHPHKNIERLVRVYARGNRDRLLVIAGMRGFQTAAIQALIAELGLQDLVTLTGWVSREKLLELYSGADVFVYPSTFEGFGMPVLEALAAGVPTACSAIPPLCEVAGDAAVTFDPHDELDIAKALHRLTSDASLREDLAKAGRDRARPFTWRRSAEQTLGVLLGGIHRHATPDAHD
jgi:glycosyltransferase involved in cell wall biosynthesis